MANKYILSIEVQKYPYCGRTDETEDYLSEKIWCYTIRIRKKIIKKAKRLVAYGDLILRLTNGVVPSQAIGLPILPTTPPIMRSIHSDTPKKVIIAGVINNSPEKTVFNEKQMDQLYDLAVKYRNNLISKEELVMELRGGGIEDWVAAFGIIIAIITLINNAGAFQVPSNPGATVPPHLEWLYGNQQPGYPSPSTSLQMQRPSTMPHQEYISLTKEQKRNLPDHRDGFISVEGHSHLVVRYGQVKFKTPDHGSVHDLPINEKGKTPKTQENALALRDSIVNMPNRKKIRWFDNGVIAIFKKQEDGEYCLFTTTCEVSEKEEEHLFKSGGNFVTEAVLNNQKALTITDTNTNDLQ